MYAPLKITTDYSLLKSLIKMDDLIKFLLVEKIRACAIVDDNLSGSIEFYNKCKDNNIKPIIGLEIIIRDKIIYLYARNYNGYKNLIKIDSFKQQSELNISLLEKYNADILCIVPYDSKDIFEELEIFEDKYLGYFTNEEKVNCRLITNNTIFINDIKCFLQSDIKYLSYLDMLANKEKQEYINNYYIKDSDVIDINEINEFVAKIDIQFPSKQRYIPKYNNISDNYNFLHDLAFKGLYRRLNNNVSDNYTNRLNFELNIIKKMDFVDYFLIVYDYVLYAKKNNILVGPGRGSAAGSLVSYSIGITEIDPIKYNLLFERFLNPERITMPDIDIDFDATKREEIIKYVQEKYGKENVALGLTFNKMKSKLVLRDLAKILKIDNDLFNKFIKNINSFKNLKDNLNNDIVKKYLHNYKELNELYKLAIKFEDLKKNKSIHAAGVVISSVSLDQVIPINYEQDYLLTGVTMDYLEDLGLLKMDFLALNNLTTIANILNKIGVDKLKNINLNDSLTLDIFNNIDVDGIFQFETPVMKNFLKKFKIESFNDLVVSLALVRPGPKDYIDLFLRRRKGLEKINYIHFDLANILNETNGIILYQEQIMLILQKFANYSLGEADIVRRAISKKKEDVLKKEKEKFINRTVNNGYSKDVAISIYNDIEKFASYGFNKSHSVAYAYISYQMAYLKAHYKNEFLLENLTNVKELNINQIMELKQNGIILEKPNVKNKNINYVFEGKKLIMPLSTIRGFNKEKNTQIIDIVNQEDDYFSFIRKTYSFLKEDDYRLLIDSGAMDIFNINHQTMVNNLEVTLNYASLATSGLELIEKPALVEYDEYDEQTLREKELLCYGFYITNHPCSKYSSKEYMKLIDIKKYVFKKIRCAVLVDNIKIIKTKNGDDMAFFSASDETANCDFTIFPRNFNLVPRLEKNKVVIVAGEVSKRFDKYQIIVNNILESGGTNAR